MEEIEKIVKRLPCSDARAIELVGMVMKENPWDWYHRNIEDQVYSSSPPTWDTFRQAVMDEYPTPVEQQNRPLWFERLKQTHETSVEDYAKKFFKLAKYAPYIVPSEAA